MEGILSGHGGEWRILIHGVGSDKYAFGLIIEGSRSDKGNVKAFFSAARRPSKGPQVFQLELSTDFWCTQQPRAHIEALTGRYSIWRSTVEGQKMPEDARSGINARSILRRLKPVTKSVGFSDKDTVHIVQTELSPPVSPRVYQTTAREINVDLSEAKQFPPKSSETTVTVSPEAAARPKGRHDRRKEQQLRRLTNSPEGSLNPSPESSWRSHSVKEINRDSGLLSSDDECSRETSPRLHHTEEETSSPKGGIDDKRRKAVVGLVHPSICFPNSEELINTILEEAAVSDAKIAAANMNRPRNNSRLKALLFGTPGKLTPTAALLREIVG
ncbi:hypothetical protein PROFUN_04344 [Planoprotostelium fungivorum]|uniref:Uncharacterized protein n=1 Tax=Planoprotostelium fungivorum TaxID=1890364 RepID=A0A2P6NHN9_9EUKA|nr:hypothetical protein PROFUN_04344 [Planoprotostelium fungivorum]